MEIKEFLGALKEWNVTLTVENEKLILKGDKSSLSKDELKDIKLNGFIINYIKENKNELMGYLSPFSRETAPIKKNKNISAIYRLSGLQEGMLFHGIYDEAVGAYIEQFSCDLIDVDPELLSRSWGYILNAHSILRTAFHYDAFKVPVQCVYKDVKLPITLLDYTGMDASRQAALIKEYAETDRARGIDFKVAPLMRFALFKLSANRYRMIWTSHHILFDGWSLPILMAEFLSNYKSLQSGEDILPREEDKFEVYIRYLDQVDKTKEGAYWSAYLAGLEQNTLLPFIAATTDRNKGVGSFKTIPLQLDIITSTKIQKFVHQNRLTVNTLVQAVWAYLLHKYTGNSNIAYGVIVSGRPEDLPGVEQRVGLYINTLILHSVLRHEQNILDWLQLLQNEQVNSRQWQHTPLQLARQWSGVQGDLFDTLLIFENYPINEAIANEQSALRVENVDYDEHTNYPLNILIQSTDTIFIRFNYNALLLDEAYVKDISGHFENVLLQLIENADGKVGDLTVLTSSQQQELLVKFNSFQTGYNTHDSIIEYFE